MRRFGSSLLLSAVVGSISLLGVLTGCGSSSSTSQVVMPAIVAISPTNGVSLDVGNTQAFSATALSITNRVLIVTISFQSSNPAVVTVANNGLACAGTWDSLTAPVVCNPGPVGTAQITATANGISSTSVPVYVHQHVDNVKVTPVTPPTSDCLSKTLTFDYQATAFSRGNDITSTVGPFTWQPADNRVVTLDTTVSGLALNQAQATAVNPGITQIVASAAGVSSEPMPFTTCLVQSISLAVEGGTDNSFTISTGNKTITPTVVDTSGTTITGVPLTWSSSQPAVLSVTTSGVATATQPGSSTVIASCTPPGCNTGTVNLALYPSGVINATVTGTGTGHTTTAWTTSTACNDAVGCVTAVAAIDVPANTISTSATLPSTPNSLVFNRQGTVAYLGSAHGLMTLDPATTPPAVTQFRNLTGKVLTVSPDGKKVIVFDQTPPGVLFIFDTSTNTSLSYPIAGVTAADFSPDNQKAFIVAGSTLYAFSTSDSLKTIPLNAPALDVSFFPEGAFAYLAGGEASAVTVRRTCDYALATDDQDPPNSQIIATSTTPAFLRTLPNATQVLAVESPTTGIDVVDVSRFAADGLCTLVSPPNPPVPNITNAPAISVNLGQGSFTPTQFFVAPDSNRAYVLTSNLASILVYNVASQTSTPVQLVNNASPIQASLTPDNTLLYVAGSDGQVHVVNPSVGGDIAQIPFPTSLCSDDTVVCKANLIAVRP